MMDKKGFKITLTPELSEELFYNALCNGLNYICSGYGLCIGYKKEDYKNAKAKLTSDPSEFQAICYEDVLMQILRDGNTLTIEEDCYYPEDSEIFTVTLSDVHARVQETPTDYLLQMINEEDDAVTADVILQTVFLGEVIYG
jgi:hypothetical protein